MVGYVRESGRSMVFLLFCFVLFLLSQLFHTEFMQRLSLEDLNAFHVFLESVGIAVGLMIGIQRWIIYPRYMTKLRVYLSAVFLGVAYFSLMHALTMQFMPFSPVALSPERSALFALAERFTVAAGLLIWARYAQEFRGALEREYYFTVTLYVLAITAFLFNDAFISQLIQRVGTLGLRIFLESLISLLNLMTLALVLKNYRKQLNTHLISLLTGIILLLFTSWNFIFYNSPSDINYYLAHFYKGFSYYFLLKGIYKGVVENSFTQQRVIEEERVRIAEEYSQLIEILPKALFEFEKDEDQLNIRVWEGYLAEEFAGIYGSRENAIQQIRVILRTKLSESEGSPLEASFTVEQRSFLVKFKVIPSEQALKCRGDKIVGSVTEVTEWLQMQEDLRLSQERFEKAFRCSPWLMAIICMEDWTYVDVNDTFLNVTKAKREEMIGKRWHGVWSNIENGKDLQKVMLEQGTVHDMEIHFYDRERGYHEGILSAEIIQMDNKRGMLVVIQDLTEKRRVDQQLTRLDQMYAVGEMAATIAHEIRNPMTTVRGFLQFMYSKESLEGYRDNFALMIEEIDRANSIITEFLSLAKNKAVCKELRDLNVSIRGLEPLLSADTLAFEKLIVLDLGDIPEILMDEKEIRQLIFNLVRNGLEAMEPGGTMKLKTFKEGNSVIFTVRDQGKGIAPEVLEKLGTPFITTKATGNGLGLAVCYSIASRHQAEIVVFTGSSGTTFMVKFPIHLNELKAS